MRYWTGPGIGIRVSFRTHEETQLFRTEEQHRRLRSGSRPSHLNVVLSKAALSCPSVCLRARAPCPLLVPCPVTACAQSARLCALLHGSRESAQLSRSLLEQIIGSRQACREAAGSGVPVASWVKIHRSELPKSFWYVGLPNFWTRGLGHPSA